MRRAEPAAAAVMLAAGAFFIATGYFGLRFSGFALTFAALAILLGMALRRAGREKRIFRTLHRAFVVCLAALALWFAASECYIISGARTTAGDDTKAVIIPGAGVYGETPSLLLKARLDAALEFAREHPQTPLVLSGGQGDGENISEAEAMRRYLTENGVDGGRLIIEDRSRSTIENMVYSKKKMEEYGIDGGKTAVVTNGFHLRRAELAARSCGIDAEGIAAQTPYIAVRLNYYAREAFALVKTEWILKGAEKNE